VTYLYTYGFQRPFLGSEARARSIDTEAVPYLETLEEPFMAQIEKQEAVRGND
jgi:hypothetical protein